MSKERLVGIFVVNYYIQHAKVKSMKSNPSYHGHKFGRKKFSDHQKANDKTILLSIENVQKVHFSYRSLRKN